jgi:hypothetical protein
MIRRVTAALALLSGIVPLLAIDNPAGAPALPAAIGTSAAATT